MKLSVKIINAASLDEGNRHMRDGGRTKWDVSDWNAACELRADLFAVLVLQSGTQVNYVNKSEEGTKS
jgi:hypothetical protein